jgi:hypothetical protein
MGDLRDATADLVSVTRAQEISIGSDGLAAGLTWVQVGSDLELGVRA